MAYGLFDERNAILKGVARPAPLRPETRTVRTQNPITQAASAQRRKPVDASKAMGDMNRTSGDSKMGSKAGFDPAQAGKRNKGFEMASNLMGMVNPVVGLVMKGIYTASLDPTERSLFATDTVVDTLDPTPFNVLSTFVRDRMVKDTQAPAPVETRDIAAQIARDEAEAAARVEAERAAEAERAEAERAAEAKAAAEATAAAAFAAAAQRNSGGRGDGRGYGGGSDSSGAPGGGSTFGGKFGNSAAGTGGRGFNGDGGDGGGDGGGSSRVICTHFYQLGDMPRSHWLADMRWTLKHCSVTTQRGYHFWAIPYVKLMRRNKFAESIMRPIALTRAKELAHRMGVSDKGSIAGKLVRMILEPASYLIGLVVEQKDYTVLYTGK